VEAEATRNCETCIGERSEANQNCCSIEGIKKLLRRWVVGEFDCGFPRASNAFVPRTHWLHDLGLPVKVIEVAPPLMDRLSAILTLEDSPRLFGPLFLRSRVVHAARTGKMDGCLCAVAHPANMIPKRVDS
jgi:hypothetical protein